MTKFSSNDIKKGAQERLIIHSHRSVFKDFEKPELESWILHLRESLRVKTMLIGFSIGLFLRTSSKNWLRDSKESQCKSIYLISPSIRYYKENYLFSYYFEEPLTLNSEFLQISLKNFHLLFVKICPKELDKALNWSI